jgi:hypothetical protein
VSAFIDVVRKTISAKSQEFRADELKIVNAAQ